MELEDETNPFFPKLFLVMMVIRATGDKPEHTHTTNNVKTLLNSYMFNIIEAKEVKRYHHMVNGQAETQAHGEICDDQRIDAQALPCRRALLGWECSLIDRVFV